MSEQASFETEVLDEMLLVRFTQPSLVFPDQVRDVEDVFSAAEQTNLRLVVLDFAQVKHISTSCWAQISRLNEILNSEGRKLRICNLNEPSRDAFDAMKFGNVLDLRASTDDALNFSS